MVADGDNSSDNDQEDMPPPAPPSPEGTVHSEVSSPAREGRVNNESPEQRSVASSSRGSPRSPDVAPALEAQQETPPRRILQDSSQNNESPNVPPTPEDESVVPATPVGGGGAGGAMPRREGNAGFQAPSTPLTPLSDLPKMDEGDDDQQEQQGEEPEADQEEESFIPPDQQTSIRGTDVHVPTAAAAFTDFLRNFVSLADSERANRRLRRQSGQDMSDDDSLSSDDDSTTEPREPLYLSRLQTLLQNGAIMTEDQDALTSSLDIDTMHLYYHSAECQRFYHQLVAYPMELVPLMDLIVKKELTRLAGNNNEYYIPRVQVRPYNLRQVSNLRCLDPVKIDSLLSIRGMIVRASPIIPDLKVAHFGCTICGHDVQVTIDRGRIQEPHNCPQCSCRDSYSLIHNRSIFADKQMVRLQETPDEVPAGQTPASVVTFCFDDLVDSVKPGDRVEVTGVLRAQPRKVHPKISKVKSVYKTYVDIIHFRRVNGMDKTNKDENDGDKADVTNASRTGMKVRFTEERVEQLMTLSQSPDIYQQLTSSLAPSIWELDNVKKGVLCMLFGGNNRRVKRGTAERRRKKQARSAVDDDSWGEDPMEDDEEEGEDDEDEEDTKLNKRGDINILLCGDPGTSKSQLLSYVNKISSRGVYTSGKGSSAVGLTASVVRDPETRELVLESGALVLSDLGVACVDEFDKMADSTRSVLHEAMEQQTVSIAKAGIIATLNARTSILASANPTESRYNPSLSVVENIQLPPTLLSRFDLIYLILDSPNVEHDRRLAQHMVGLYYETPNVVQPPMDQELLRDYIDYARDNIHPELSDEAARELVASYLDMRRMGNAPGSGTRTISATPRQLESLIRLSEALAKMRYSHVVTRADAREALRLMRVATQAAATDPRTGRIDMDMITTGRSTADREMEENLNISLKELFAERRGNRMAVRDVVRQLGEITNVAVSHDEVVEALRRMEADGIVQFNERAQSVFVRAGIVA